MQFQVDLKGRSRGWIEVDVLLDPVELPEVVRDGHLELFMAVWTPGSYLVREYQRRVVGLRYREAGVAEGGWRTPPKSSKNRWRLQLSEAGVGVQIRYRIYARELTVRTAFASHDWVFWNGATLLLWPVHGSKLGASVQVELPTGWQLWTGDGLAGDGCLRLRDLDHAIDTPCLAGEPETLTVTAGARSHRFVAVGLGGLAIPDHFADDLRRILEAARAVVGGDLPLRRDYTFLALFSETGRGGLEHCESSTLLAPRETFSETGEYENFLGLIAHEYFHVWNVKRMRPAEFWSYDYEHEVLTDLLWVAEGFTAYYDDLICLRAGVLQVGSYLELVSKQIRDLEDNPGRFEQSLSEASRDAWILLYRADETTRNLSQNYYGNGAVAALVLDSEIRRASGGESCLDDAVRSLWHSTWEKGRGYTLEDVIAALSRAAARDMGDLVRSLVHGPLDPDLDAALGVFGLRVGRKSVAPWFGAKLGFDGTGLAAVRTGSPADVAGLRAGDELLAFAGVRVTESNWGKVWRAVVSDSESVSVLVAREGLLHEVTVVPQPNPRPEVQLVSVDRPSEEQLRHREAWLGTRVLNSSSRASADSDSI